MRKIRTLFLNLIIALAVTAGFIFCCGFSFHTREGVQNFAPSVLCSFTTYFDKDNKDRCHNIRLASKLIDGTKIENGEVFSFNSAVGERTVKRGFKIAKIIKDGEFVEGVGGGVCQVSTTLYNAALLSGCIIREYHPHSLPVSYVAPSRDAMVSGTYYDLKFQNVSGREIYIKSSAGANYVRFTLYGISDGAKYELSTFVTGTIAAGEEQTDDIALVRAGRDGIISEGYLTVTKNGVTKVRLLRRDKYAPQKRVVLKTEEENKDGELPEITDEMQNGR